MVMNIASRLSFSGNRDQVCGSGKRKSREGGRRYSVTAQMLEP